MDCFSALKPLNTRQHPPPLLPFPKSPSHTIKQKDVKQKQQSTSFRGDVVIIVVLVVSPSLELFNANHHVQVALGILLDHVSHVVGFPCLLPSVETEGGKNSRDKSQCPSGPLTSMLCYHDSVIQQVNQKVVH